MKSRKLNKREFARAIRHGLGSALLHVRDYGDAGVEKLIIDACLHDYVFERQSNSNRARWLFRLIQTTGRSKHYARFIQDALQENKIDSSFNQLAALANHFFEGGFYELKSSLLQFIPLVEQSEQECLEYFFALIDISGRSGVETGAKLLGAKNAHGYDVRSFYEYACDAFGRADVDEFLKARSEVDIDISRFWKTLQEYRKERKPEPYVPEIHKLDELLEEIEKNSDHTDVQSKFRWFGKSASEEDLQRVFQLIENENESWRLRIYLATFERTPLPVVSSKILSLIYSEQAELRRAACDVLREIKSMTVRRAALKALQAEQGEFIVVGINLLHLNFSPQDFELLEKALLRLKSQEHLHFGAMYLRDIAAESKHRQLASLLCWAYEFTPCAFCRRIVVRLLIEWECAPPQLLYEALWDCESETRLLVRAQVQPI